MDLARYQALVATGLARAGRLAADLLTPPVCAACGRRIGSPDALCAECWREVAFIRQPLCDRLGIPLPYATVTPTVSAAALADPPIYDRARAVAAFGPVMRRLVHQLKYQDRHHGRVLFGCWLADAGRDLLGEADVLVPVPLHPMRLLARRFNQSAILANELGRVTGLPVDVHSLQRTRRTPPQVDLTAEQRRLNVRGAFRVRPDRRGRIAGRRVLLIEDVVTTGATITACARALKRAGAARVDVLALAMRVHE